MLEGSLLHGGRPLPDWLGRSRVGAPCHLLETEEGSATLRWDRPSYDSLRPDPSWRNRSIMDWLSVGGNSGLDILGSMRITEARPSTKLWHGAQPETWARNFSSRDGGSSPSMYSEESFRTSAQSRSFFRNRCVIRCKGDMSLSPRAILFQRRGKSNIWRRVF